MRGWQRCWRRRRRRRRRWWCSWEWSELQQKMGRTKMIFFSLTRKFFLSLQSISGFLILQVDCFGFSNFVFVRIKVEYFLQTIAISTCEIFMRRFIWHKSLKSCLGTQTHLQEFRTKIVAHEPTCFAKAGCNTVLRDSNPWCCQRQIARSGLAKKKPEQGWVKSCRCKMTISFKA